MSTQTDTKETDMKWFVDVLSDYLKSPIFRMQIKDYIDSKCLTFNGGGGECSFEQTIIHNVNII